LYQAGIGGLLPGLRLPRAFMEIARMEIARDVSSTFVISRRRAAKREP
jgi:hypothetical protein